MFLNTDNLDEEWKQFIENERKEDYFKKLEKSLETEYNDYTCYPKKEDIFNAFKLCAFSNVRVEDCSAPRSNRWTFEKI